ncbi:MAG TPA: alpha/beta fold hydrolase [Candidatus Paceibacterota bacterium]
MKTALIIHGMPSKREYFNPANPSPSNNHWFPWLQRQLILNGVLAQTPEMPTPYEPRYEAWAAMLGQFHIDEDTMLVGHSLGGGFLVRWLSEYKGRVGRVVLVAPWLDPNKELTTSFFDFSIDPALAGKTRDSAVFISDDDDQEELASLETLKNTVTGLRVKEFTGRGHFILEHMGTEEFPELRDYLVREKQKLTIHRKGKEIIIRDWSR